MHKREGFTLVELLVVIAIIALLMSILMPALARVRKQAKSVICLSNLKQWAMVFSAYTSDYDGFFCGGWQGRPGATGQSFDSSNWWTSATRSYYKDAEILCCPMATKPYLDGGMPPLGAWPGQGYLGLEDDDVGSYGLNGWVEDNQGQEWGLNPNKRWRHCNVSGTDEIPLLLGNVWVDGWPEYYDEPPQTPVVVREGEYNYMQRFCMDRHEGRVGGLFMDSSVRLIDLKELWVLRWHRKYDMYYPPPTWPEWMKRFPDYALETK